MTDEPKAAVSRQKPTAAFLDRITLLAQEEKLFE
jgi:hypothetical protein